MKHDVFCNVGRIDACSRCGKWVSYCFTHREPTDNNRCICFAIKEER